MKQFAAAAAEIVRRTVEAVEDEDFEVKDVSDVGQEDYWHQIAGDASPWVWGGSWYNPDKKEIIHFNGIDYEGGEVDYKDIEVPAQVLAKLPPEQPDWRENKERDAIIDNYRIARAEFLNNRKQYSFWKIDADRDVLPSWLQRYDNPNHYEQWDQLSLPQKLIEIGEYIGMNEIGSEFKMNYQQAQALLGSNNV